MSNDVVSSTEKTITKDEPVIVAHAALWLVAMVGEILVGRTHVVDGREWTALSSTLVPIVTTILLGLSAWLMRSVVSPAGAFAQRVETAVQDRVEKLHIPFATGGPVQPMPDPAVQELVNAGCVVVSPANHGGSWPNNAAPAEPSTVDPPAIDAAPAPETQPDTTGAVPNDPMPDTEPAPATEPVAEPGPAPAPEPAPADPPTPAPTA